MIYYVGFHDGMIKAHRNKSDNLIWNEDFEIIAMLNDNLWMDYISFEIIAQEIEGMVMDFNTFEIKYMIQEM